jgi:hypothetical protein
MWLFFCLLLLGRAVCFLFPCCRDEQLAKFEAYLNKEECLHINALVRSRSRMAYPMKG